MSLIFQCIPILIDILKDQEIGTSMVLVVSPLNPLMFDQMEKLKATAVPGAAIYESQTQEMLAEIRNGDYSLVYTSPESMLASGDQCSLVRSSEQTVK